MAELESGPLRHFTPCRSGSDERVVKALATVHTELMLIHPFREGNGRAGRLLAILMGLQAKLPPLDFSGIKGKKGSNILRRCVPVSGEIMNGWSRSLATSSVGPGRLLYERSLAGIFREGLRLDKGHFYTFNGSRGTDRSVK